jgi:hypothetical protein
LEPTEQTEFCAAIPEMAKILNKQGELLQKDFMKIPLSQRAKFACPDENERPRHLATTLRHNQP